VSVVKLSVSSDESFVKSLLVITMSMHLLLNKLRQPFLDIGRYLLAILTMPVSHSEMMASWQLQQIGVQDEVILVLLIWVVWDEAHACGEGEFSDDVYIFFDLERLGDLISA